MDMLGSDFILITAYVTSIGQLERKYGWDGTNELHKMGEDKAEVDRAFRWSRRIL